MGGNGGTIPVYYNMNLILTGFMGTGKTAVGKILARRLERRFVDTDRVIEELTGLTIPCIFDIHGEDYFRDRESEAVEMLNSYPRGTLVAATGGGAVLREINRQNLRRHGLIILLTASVRAIVRRTHGDTDRPLLLCGRRRRENIEELFRQREPCYMDHDLTVDTTGKSPASVAAAIIKLLDKVPGTSVK